MATEGTSVSSEKDVVSRSSTDIVEDLSKDYAKYMEVEVSSETEQFADSIEEMLTRLDEYCGLVDIIRSDTSLCLNRTLPEIYKKTKDMEKIFERIDQLEAYVSMVKKTVNDMERQVEKAESEMGTLSSFKKMFSFALPGFLGSAKPSQRQANQPQPSCNPPPIFNTKKCLSYNKPSSPVKTFHPPATVAESSAEAGGEGGSSNSADVQKSVHSDTGTIDSGIASPGETGDTLSPT